MVECGYLNTELYLRSSWYEWRDVSGYSMHKDRAWTDVFSAPWQPTWNFICIHWAVCCFTGPGCFHPSTLRLVTGPLAPTAGWASIHQLHWWIRCINRLPHAAFSGHMLRACPRLWFCRLSLRQRQCYSPHRILEPQKDQTRVCYWVAGWATMSVKVNHLIWSIIIFC